MEVIREKFNEYKRNENIDIEFSEEQLKEISNLENNNNLIDAVYNKLVEMIYSDETAVYGYIYCIYNELFMFYGENVYKLGCTKDITGRLSSYCTSYIKKCELIKGSNEMKHYKIAVKLLFKLLSEYRIVSNSEFFKCDPEIIKSKIDEVEKIINTVPISEILMKYDICQQTRNEIYNYIKTICNKTNIKTIIKPQSIKKRTIIKIKNVQK